MTATAILAVLAGLVAVAYIYLKDPVVAWRRYRGVRLVKCPETGVPAAVLLDLGHAAFTTMAGDPPDLRLAHCSRWHSRGVCDEPCLGDVLELGDAGKVETIVNRWYAAQTCGYCGKPVVHPTSTAHTAAVVGPDGVTTEWSALPAEHLPEVLGHARAVCWNCHVAESFRRTYPDLYVDRQPPADRRV